MADTTGPVRTGSLTSDRDKHGKVRHRGRIRLADGTRLRIPVPAGFSEARARDFVAAIQEREDAEGLLLAKRLKTAGKAPDGGETVDAWFARHLAAKDCGEAHRQTSKFRWGKHVSPAIGSLPVATLTRDQIESVRDYLDREVDRGLSGASARNVWSLVVDAMKAACAAKDRTLRVHSTPIHLGILPPKKTRPRRRPWLFPAEWASLAACAAVPIASRQMYAIALYTGARPGELTALTWGDVDAASGSISITKAWDHAAQKVGPPKTEAGHRTFPIHPELRPLLDALRGPDHERVIAKPEADRLAGQFRDHLRLAGVDRPRLFALTPTEEPVDFRSLRDSHATWAAIEGVSVTALRRRMGHQSLETTDHYVKSAETISAAGIGSPFPALPRELLSRDGGPPIDPRGSENGAFHGEKQRRGWDSNPRMMVLQTIA